MSFSTDLPIFEILVLIGGPAIVFVTTYNFITLASLSRKLKQPIGPELRLRRPHDNVLSYATFPFVFALLIWIFGLVGYTPYDLSHDDFIASVLKPGWLVKYGVFNYVIGVLAAGMGVLAGQLVLPTLDKLRLTPHQLVDTE